MIIANISVVLYSLKNAASCLYPPTNPVTLYSSVDQSIERNPDLQSCVFITYKARTRTFGLSILTVDICKAPTGLRWRHQCQYKNLIGSNLNQPKASTIGMPGEYGREDHGAERKHQLSGLALKLFLVGARVSSAFPNTPRFAKAAEGVDSDERFDNNIPI